MIRQASRIDISTWAITFLFILSSCSDMKSLKEEQDVDVKRNGQSQRQQTLQVLRDRAASRGIYQITTLAGIANAETGLAHCWKDVQWACQGPNSDSCGGGPVTAGAGDGACWRKQGGLGLFQLDAGTYDQTIRREGWQVLDLAGNIDAGISFVINMVRSAKRFNNDQATIDWLNGITVGSERYNDWLDIVVEKYNGCVYGRCSIFLDRWYHYDEKTRAVIDDIERLPSKPTVWIGSICHQDEDCDFRVEGEWGRCLKGIDGGVCIVSCEGYCPDQVGQSPTFCAIASQTGYNGAGICLAQSNSLNRSCGEEHLTSVSVNRWIGNSGASSKSATVCIPSQETKADNDHQSNGFCDHDTLPISEESCNTTQENTWRCACHASYETTVSQVCRGGEWVNYRLDPSDCSRCEGDTSQGCE